MSRENLEIVQRAFAEFERGNFWVPEFFEPSVRIVWLSALAAGESESVGLRDMGQGIKDWLASWERVTMTAERLIDAGDQVAVIAVWRGCGKASGVATEWRHGQVWTMRDGKATRVMTYGDPSEALEAVGLREPAVSDEHRQLLERFYAAFNARDLSAILAEMHPEIEFQSRFAQAGGALYHGHDGVRGWLEDLDQAWEHLEVELEQTVESGIDATIALVTLHGKGRVSGLEIHEPAAHDLRWRDGKLARLAYTDRRAAGRLAGPS